MSLAIASNELLLITVQWTSGINKGSTNTLELDVRAYTASEVQQIIDENMTDTCTVVQVDRYDFVRRVGEDISEDFDMRTHIERQETDRVFIRSNPSAFDRRQQQRSYSALAS